MFRTLFLFTAAAAVAAGGTFVKVEGPRVDPFEMADRPVTNAEYKVFVDATKHVTPLHWKAGQIPEGMAQHPVIFVNRFDVADYLAWRTKQEKRIYRLPTVTEFQTAQSSGVEAKAKYPWGSESPEGKTNYDPNGMRTFAEWRKYIKPVASYGANKLGLYDLAGNVWQMVDSRPDYEIAQYKYRIETPDEEENSLAGGSWARSEYYLRIGVRGSASSGIRHPDIGFRVVREPAGMTHFHKTARRVVTASAGGGAVYIGWQLLPGDKESTGFYIYRATRLDGRGERITQDPVRGSTNFVDRSAPEGRVYYRVRAVETDGKEGAPSEWAGITTDSKRNPAVMVFEPTVKEGGMVPVFGDLDGDGRLDAVIRLDNGIKEMSRDPGKPVEVEAFTSFGKQLWRRPLVNHDHCFGNANNVPVVVYDLDGDGKAEVIVRLQEGDGLFLAVLDGMTGRVKHKTPWTKMATDYAKTSTRVHMSVAYLNGKTPAIVTQTGLYENEIIDAYDAKLNKLWQYKSFAETNGSGSHHLDVADLDGDGKDEVIDGTTVLNPDGTLKWSIYREHPDIVAVKHILPGTKERQIFYAVESNVHAGAYVVEAKTGKIIWKLNREDDPRWSHAHTGWAADILENSPGMEMLTNRDGHVAKDTVLFSSDGKILMNPFPQGWRPVNWTGGATRELMNSGSHQIGRFDGKKINPIAGAWPEGAGGCNMTADLIGDYRDEMVCVIGGKVLVYTNLEPLGKREVTRTSSREYRQWLARNMGGGYPSYFEYQPE